MRFAALLAVGAAATGCVHRPAPADLGASADTVALTAALGKLVPFWAESGGRTYLLSAASIDSVVRPDGPRHHSAEWLRTARSHFRLAGICGTPNIHCATQTDGYFLAVGELAPYHADTAFVTVGWRYVAAAVRSNVGERARREWAIGLFRSDTIYSAKGWSAARRYRVYLVRRGSQWVPLAPSDRLPESVRVGLQP